MKTLFITIVGILYSVSIFADCMANGLSVFPTTKTLSQNSIIILDGYAQSQNVIKGLNIKFPVYLKSGDKIVKLLVVEIHTGQFNITQAILKPEKQLEAGLEYTMFIDNLPEDESLYHYNTETKEREPIQYKILEKVDNDKPIIVSKPKEVKKTFRQYGCGPATYVIFDYSIKDSSVIIIKATVKNLKTGRETTYYIKPSDNQISIGHGMCSGAFKFDDSLEYEIEFSFMDASGNMANWTGERINFTKPTYANQE